ncbi:MAG: hypothetical protein ACFCUJ_11910 [Thiotrichales bacterium]
MKVSFLFSALLAALVAGVGAAQARDAAVLESLFVTERCQPTHACLFTYTLASLTGAAIDGVEARIGPRDPGYMLLGVEFVERGSAGIWFPGNKDHVVIQLTESAMVDEKRALFQLAHEAFHTVTPVPGSVNVLEEGMATEFSLDFVRDRGFDISPDYIASHRYARALAAVTCLRGLEPELNARITALRAGGVKLGKVTAQQLATALPGVPRALIDGLVLPFDRIDEIEATLSAYCGAANATANR